ncbi:hypothetical protein GCM10027345_09980 [Hymenobacter daeguensis]
MVLYTGNAAEVTHGSCYPAARGTVCRRPMPEASKVALLTGPHTTHCPSRLPGQAAGAREKSGEGQLTCKRLPENKKGL